MIKAPRSTLLGTAAFIHQRMRDAALMSECPATLANSFEEVFRQREREVLRTAYRVLGNWADAEDVAQEAFIRLHKHGVDFQHEAALRCWLYRVVVNLCLDRKRAFRPAEEVTEWLAVDDSAEASAIREQEKHAVMAALATLPPRERAAIVLREIEGFSTAEVAAILGSAEVTVRSQVAKAFGKLRTILNREKL